MDEPMQHMDYRREVMHTQSIQDVMYHLLSVTSTPFALWHIMIWSLVTRLLNLLFRVTSVFVIYSVLPVHVLPYDKYLWESCT